VCLKPDGTQCSTGGEVKNKLANGVGSQYSHTTYPALLPLMRTPRLPAVDWTDAPADLNGLVRFSERRNLVPVCVPSRFKRSLPVFLPRRYRPTGQGASFYLSLARARVFIYHWS
jgi:hypothetical protein